MRGMRLWGAGWMVVAVGLLHGAAPAPAPEALPPLVAVVLELSRKEWPPTGMAEPIADTLAKAGDADMLLRLGQEGRLRAVPLLWERGERNRAAEVASQALWHAQAQPEGEARGQALTEVAAAYFRTGQMSRADEVLRLAESGFAEEEEEEPARRMARGLVFALHRVGDGAAAVKAAERIGDVDERQEVLKELMERAGWHRPPTATDLPILRALAAIADDAEVLIYAGMRLTEVGTREEVVGVARRALLLVRRLQEADERRTRLLECAWMLAWVGASEEAVSVIDEGAGGGGIIPWRHHTLSVTSVLARAGDAERAIRRARGIRTVGGGAPVEAWVEELSEAACIFAEHGNEEALDEAVAAALECMAEEPSEGRRVAYLAVLANALVRGGAPERARAVLESEAIPLARQLAEDEPSRHDGFLADLAGALAECGDFERAHEVALLVSEAYQIRDIAFLNVAKVHLGRGAVAEALALRRYIQLMGALDSVLSSAALDFVQQGKYEIAWQMAEAMVTMYDGGGLGTPWGGRRLLHALGIALLGEGLPAAEQARWAGRLREAGWMNGEERGESGELGWGERRW